MHIPLRCKITIILYFVSNPMNDSVLWWTGSTSGFLLGRSVAVIGCVTKTDFLCDIMFFSFPLKKNVNNKSKLLEVMSFPRVTFDFLNLNWELHKYSNRYICDKFACVGTCNELVFAFVKSWVYFKSISEANCVY